MEYRTGKHTEELELLLHKAINLSVHAGISFRCLIRHLFPEKIGFSLIHTYLVSYPVDFVIKHAEEVGLAGAFDLTEVNESKDTI